MKGWGKDPKTIPRKLKRLGFKPVHKDGRTITFARNDAEIILPKSMNDPRAMENWLHANRDKFGDTHDNSR